MTRLDSYAYRAARQDGAVETGAVEAGSREAAGDIIIGKGLFPIEVKLDTTLSARRARMPAQELALGLRLLAELLEAGLTVSRVLGAFADLAPPSWRVGLPAVQESVRLGNSLARALEESPLEIPQVVVGIIEAGEAGAGLAAAVRRAAELSESAATTRAAVRSALVYPVVLAFAGLASLALLVGVVLPRFAAVLSDTGQALPVTTALVLGTADVLRASVVPAAVATALAFLVWRTWVKTEGGRAAWHRVLLTVPTVGKIRRSAATARAGASLSALLDSGVPVAAALLHGARAAGDAEVGARIVSARESILNGQGVAWSLGAEDAMTPTAVQLVRAGEETGQLASMFAQAARIEEQMVERTVRGAVKLLEPTLILLFGGVVALVAAALLQAVYGVKIN